ncbi:unnamed protein product [Parajaminaea phylloscopi]
MNPNAGFESSNAGGGDTATGLATSFPRPAPTSAAPPQLRGLSSHPLGYPQPQQQRLQSPWEAARSDQMRSADVGSHSHTGTSSRSMGAVGAAAPEESQAGPIRQHSKAASASRATGLGSAGSSAYPSSHSTSDSTRASGLERGPSSASPPPDVSDNDASGANKKAPVRAACLFCRARKSRCDGKQPCHNCINRGKESECMYTVSRRGGKPKPKPNQSQEEANLELHLKRLFNLSQLPQQVRVPGAVPQLLEAQQEQQQSQQRHQPQPSPHEQPPWTPFTGLFPNVGSSPFDASGVDVPAGAQPSQPPMAPALPLGMSPANPAILPASPWSMPSMPNTADAYNMSTGMSQPLSPMSGPSMPVRSVHSILLGYYNHLYRFIPVFLPPRYIDVMAARYSYDSPFILSLQAILPLLEQAPPGSQMTGQTADSGLGFGMHPGGSHTGTRTPSEQLLQVTSYYERRASEAIEAVLERAESHMAVGKADSVNSQGSTLGVIQALAVLCVYHYGCGRALKARLKADQALGLCMAKGLHRLKRPASYDGTTSTDSTSKSSFVAADGDPFGRQSLFMDMPDGVLYEMQKRLWWTCWSSCLWCAYNTAIAPTVRADDPRVRTEVPSSVDPKAWPENVQSLQLLLLIQERVLALSHGKDSDNGGLGQADSTASTYAGSSVGIDGTHNSQGLFSSLPANASRQDILDSMLEIDRSLQSQILDMESDSATFHKLCERPSFTSLDASDLSETAFAALEEDLATYLRRSAAIQVYTSSLTLHLGQAFQGATLFERKLCFLNTTRENGSGAACQVPMPDSFSSIFPSGDEGQQGSVPSGGWHTDRRGEHESFEQPLVAQLQARQVVANPNQDLFARGPFLPKESLSRCIHASKRLLEIARYRQNTKEPNPFNACSFVLISFTLLMQALAVNSNQDPTRIDRADGDGENASTTAEGDVNVGDGLDDSEMRRAGEHAPHDNRQAALSQDFDFDSMMAGSQGFPPRGPEFLTGKTDHPGVDVASFSRNMMQSAQAAAAFGDFTSTDLGDTTGLSDFSSQAPTDLDMWSFMQQEQPQQILAGATDGEKANIAAVGQRRAKLHDIWSRVSEAHATLRDLSKYWKMVEPMADEVSLCLETSQMLLKQ